MGRRWRVPKEPDDLTPKGENNIIGELVRDGVIRHRAAGGGVMPLRKIRDLESKTVCQHPDHSPPSLIVLPDGVYEHTCPSCGKRVEFTVAKPR